ncbi:14841_t:CDS:2 [Entrophospora sp. SA101]|nr:897_t:CDS:2 [Entrophospora sp. SA101]CAJ0650757.1 11990_t:CDS:2 [Entrophospora sp. SA101]CAJ0650765.1 11997_t:CDS:2 [Entrophospora sp. SA101]CAJ0757867.1 14841_t:CDS:2 [Entrophospora sp. SA101]CAJ0831901.1 14660_t:CDS:2 [Entrophospora sp. SA101]
MINEVFCNSNTLQGFMKSAGRINLNDMEDFDGVGDRSNDTDVNDDKIRKPLSEFKDQVDTSVTEELSGLIVEEMLKRLEKII